MRRVMIILGLIKKVLLACFPGLDGALLDADGNILASKAGILAPSLDLFIASGNVTLIQYPVFATDRKHMPPNVINR